MKVKIITENENPYLVLEYEGGEKEKIHNKFRDLGIETTTTERAWGEDITLEYYRATNRTFFNSLNLQTGYREEFVDDINSKVFEGGVFNIAVFRAVPTANKIKVPLDSMLTIVEINNLASRIAKAVETIYNVFTGEVEIKVNTGL
jgi:hypothetical protein